MRVGFVPNYQKQSGVNTIRLKYIAQHFDEHIVTDDYKDLKDCAVVVLYARLQDFEQIVKLHKSGVRLILDMADPHWDNVNYNPNGVSRGLLNQILPFVDVVTLPTDEIKCSFMQYRQDKVLKIIPDSIDLSTHNKVVKHKKKDKYNILWYGSFGNIESLELARKDLERLGKEYNIKLTAIYDMGHGTDVKPYDNVELSCIEWSEQVVIAELLKSDLSINPRFVNWKKYKSNNKTIKAWSLGVPCIERDFYKEIKKYLRSQALRNKEGTKRRKEVKAEYNSVKSASILKEICRELLKKPCKPKNKIAVVTAIIGGEDCLREDQFIDSDVDYIAYMDRDVASPLWDVRKVSYSPYKEAVRQAKMYKVLPHLYLPEYDYVLWMDGTMALRGKVQDMITKFLTDSDIAVFPHKDRDCVYKEYIVDMNLARHSYGEPLSIREDQRRRYKADGLKPKSGLYECGFILRRQTPQIERLNERWWAEISIATSSDQVPFRYALYKTGIKITKLSPGNMYNSNWSHHIPHGTVPNGKGKPMPYYPNQITEVGYGDIEDNDMVYITYTYRDTYHYSKVGVFSQGTTKKMLGKHAKHLLTSQPERFILCKEL